MTQTELIRRIDRNRAWQWQVMTSLVLAEAFAALAVGLVLLFPESPHGFFHIGLIGVLFPFFGMSLPALAGSAIEGIGGIRCPACRKRNRSELVLRNGFCTHCGTLFFIPEPTAASAFRNRSTVIANLTGYLLWMMILYLFFTQLEKDPDSPQMIIADSALIQSGLLFLMLPLMWYLRTCSFGRRIIRPLDRLAETVTLPLSRTELRRTRSRESLFGLIVAGLAIIPPVAVIGFLGRPARGIDCILLMVWMFGVLAFGIVWSLRRDRRGLPPALLEQCPACRRGGRFRFFRWKSDNPYVDELFWRTVLKTSRCPNCGCRLRFQDDPEETRK